MDGELEVSESEGEAVLCVSISLVIARPLNFIITHNSITSGTRPPPPIYKPQLTAAVPKI